MPILHSNIIGQGQPLLILHGYFGMGDNWKTLGNQFSEHFEVHMIDQRNHGRSFHADRFDYEVMVEDLYKYVEHHSLENPIVLGHSMGGKTAMLYAVENQERIHSLIVADISPRFYKPHHNEILKALNSVDFAIHNSRSAVDEQIKKYIPEVGVRQFLLKNLYWKEKGVLDYRFNLESLTKNNSEVGKALPSFTVFEGNSLFLAGEKSNYITSKEESLIKAHFPKATIVTISNAGHWLHAENPQDFYSEVLSFLSKN